MLILRPFHGITTSWMGPATWVLASLPGDPLQFGSLCTKPESGLEKSRVDVDLEIDLVFFFFFFESPMQFQDFQKPGLPFQPLLFFDAEKLLYATIFRKEGGEREECPELSIQIWTLSSNFFPLLEMMRHPGRNSDENTRRTLKFISALPSRKEPWHLLEHKAGKMLWKLPKDFQVWMK